MQFSAAIVGGGPGGLMAAERLAQAGGAVTIYERTPSVGRKFLLAGRSGLNLTHAEQTDALLDRYGDARPKLDAAIRAFDSHALRDWAASLGEPTYVGTSGRVFPTSMRANGLLRAWIDRLRSLGVTISVGHRFVGWSGEALEFETADGETVTATADIVVFALGGGSWPSVGSDGQWVEPLRNAGIDVSTLRAANSGFVVDWSEGFVRSHEGEPLKNLVVSCDGASARGEAVITDSGVEGGVFYAVGATLRDRAERDGSVTAVLDLHPDLDHGRLVERLARRRDKDTLSATLKRAGLSAIELSLVNEVLRAPAQLGGVDLPAAADVERLAGLLKNLPLRLVGPEPIDRAISTAGGVALDEVDEHFMLRSRPGTFVVGEMLDWEAPTGGYLLQATFSTAVAAADGALAWLAAR